MHNSHYGKNYNIYVCITWSLFMQLRNSITNFNFAWVLQTLNLCDRIYHINLYLHSKFRYIYILLFLGDARILKNSSFILQAAPSLP